MFTVSLYKFLWVYTASSWLTSAVYWINKCLWQAAELHSYFSYEYFVYFSSFSCCNSKDINVRSCTIVFWSLRNALCCVCMFEVSLCFLCLLSLCLLLFICLFCFFFYFPFSSTIEPICSVSMLHSFSFGSKILISSLWLLFWEYLFPGPS